MQQHPFDVAMGLQAQVDGAYLGHTHPGYANMVGPFGGITAAQMLRAALLHPQCLGEPLSLTVNFCAAVVDGPFTVRAQPVRTNRSTQHWWIEMAQQGQVVTTASLVTAVRRSTWSADDTPMPNVAPPVEAVVEGPVNGPLKVSVEVPPISAPANPIAFVARYEIQPLLGDFPRTWDGRESSSLSQFWVRDRPARVLDFPALACMADIFFPRIYLRRALPVPIGTVSMTVYFHADAAQLQHHGEGFLLGQARAQTFQNGFFDQTAQMWTQQGTLLATTQQIVYYKE
jgi:acyl-CoA thioesterase